MAARSSKKRPTATTKGMAASLDRLERSLPPTLREFAGEIRKRLDRLEKDAARAQIEARKRAARLLREASHQLGRLEVGGEAAWRKLGASYQKELVALLKRLEKAMAPVVPKRRAKKKASSASSEAASNA